MTACPPMQRSKRPIDTAQQRLVCARYGAAFAPPATGSRIGIALATLDRQPLNGMRIAPHGTVCGWYLWGGGAPSSDADFYQPLCVEHLEDKCPAAVPFLALPPGWRFLTDGTYVDVWYDAGLLQPTDAADL
jgi:hypothetical protein